MSLLLALSCLVTVLLPISSKNVSAEDRVVVESQPADTKVIPDKYNTGAKGTLTKFVDKSDQYGLFALMGKQNGKDQPVMIKRSDIKDDQGNVIDHTYNFSFMNKDNQKLSGEIVFENIDFTGFILQALQEDLITSDLILTFKNCKIDVFSRSYEGDNKLTCKFYSCNIRRYVGPNAGFYNCAFGGSVDDPIHPLKNVEIIDSYFSDMNFADNTGTHIDAIQIFGGKRTGADADNIKLSNCRFELPQIYFDNSSSYINACLMVQLEFGNAHNIRIEDCYVNGGGYTIYAQTKDKILENVNFKNIHVGAAHIFGAVYPNIDKNVRFEELNSTDTLYVSSVYKSGGKTCLSVSNDTNHERKLLVVTDKGEYNFTVKAGPDVKSLQARNFKSFSDLPVDIIETIDADCSYLVCFDVTVPNNPKQIRFVNYTGDQVTLDKKYYGYDYSTVIAEGSCGHIKHRDTVKYTLTADYVLTVYGEGVMGNFGDGYECPWLEYSDLIRKVVIKKGVTNVGTNTFKNSFNVKTVVLEEGVTRIEGRAFENCTTLEKVYAASSFEFIADNAFQNIPRDIAGNIGSISEVPQDTVPSYTIISVTTTPTPSPSPSPASSDSRTQIEAFVKRLYNNVLGREAEEGGLKFWSDELYYYRRTGAFVALEFMLSDEFINKNTSNEDFVTVLYRTYFGREPEAGGFNYWIGELTSGRKTRTTVAKDFIYSQEWADTCASYGILSGGDLKPSKAIEPSALTYAFVERMYTVAMGRTYDDEGRAYWAKELANYNITGEYLGVAFFISPEMNDKNLSNKEFVNRLYQTFMNREGETDGVNYWVGQLDSGVSRQNVVLGFTRSPEFTDKCIEARILPF